MTRRSCHSRTWLSMKSVLDVSIKAIATLFAACSVATAANPTPPATQLGRKIESFSLQDFRGKTWPLAEFQGKQATVVAFIGVECPIAGQYASRLRDLAAKYADAGIAFVAI